MLKTHNKSLVITGMLVMTLLAYYQITSNAFVSYDDALYVTENANIKEGITVKGVWWAFSSIYASNWHPLTWLSHMVDISLFGMNSYGHHLTNIILHITNTFLLYRLLFLLTEKHWESLVVATLFALHPLHVESVAWVAERKDLLSTMFMLLTMMCYRRYVDNFNRLYYIETLGLYVCGLLSKPMLVTLPLLMLLIDYWPLGRGSTITKFRSLTIEKLPFMALAMLSSFITFVAQKEGGTVVSQELIPLWARLQNAINSYLMYINKTLIPFNLSIIYPYKEISVLNTIFASIILIGITTLVIWKKIPYLIVGWMWYLVSLVPVIGIVQVGSQAMADRYSYMPLIGLFIIIAWGGADLQRTFKINTKAVMVGVTIIVIFLAYNTRLQTMTWKNSIELFKHAVAVVPDNNIALMMLGDNYLKQGDFISGTDSLKKAVTISPSDPIAQKHLGIALMKQNMFDEAIYHFLAALRANPADANTHYNYGVALAKIGRFEEAIGQYSEALTIDPTQNDVKSNMGAALYHLGRLDEAEFYFLEALKADPTNETLRRYLAIVAKKQVQSKR